MVIVKNHFPGRIRLKAREISLYPGIGDWIKQSLIAIQGVREVRINEYAGSIIVDYDEQLLDSKTIQARISALNFSEGERSEEIEHQYTPW